MKNQFNVNELPQEEMLNLGVIDPDGNFAISQQNVEAMLAGRRTSLVRLNDLEAGGFRIEHLDAKLSLQRDGEGKVGFKIHPIYKSVTLPKELESKEALALMQGELQSVPKTKAGPGKQKVVYEFDHETNEFVSYNPDLVLAPDKINGYKLNESQKTDFREGQIVELPDGTQLQHSATDPKGIRADRAALIASVLIDGGISYLLFRAIKHLMNNKLPQQAEETAAFKKAYAEMEKHFAKKGQTVEQGTEETRGYNNRRAR